MWINIPECITITIVCNINCVTMQRAQIFLGPIGYFHDLLCYAKIHSLNLHKELACCYLFPKKSKSNFICHFFRID